MGDVVRWVLVPVIVLGGWWLARRRDRLALQATRALPVLLGMLLASIAVSGQLHAGARGADFHKSAAHGFVIAIWLCVPFTAGVTLQCFVPQRPLMAIASFSVLAIVMGVSLLAAMTGYLGPSSGESDTETNRRFIVLHTIVLPVAVGLLLCAWFVLTFMSDRRRAG
jgi:hypothetical protein